MLDLKKMEQVAVSSGQKRPVLVVENPTLAPIQLQLPPPQQVTPWKALLFASGRAMSRILSCRTLLILPARSCCSEHWNNLISPI